MPSSVRVIRIVKDPFTKEETYTVEFECECEESKKLMNELAASPLGRQVIDLLNEADFLPKESQKSPEELKAEAEAEEDARNKREQDLRLEGKLEERKRYVIYIKRKLKKVPSQEEIDEEVEKDAKEDDDENEQMSVFRGGMT